MKRLFLVIVAMLSMTMTFAENEEAKNVNQVEAYDMSVNMRKLSVTLGLTTDQIEAVENVHNYFAAEMQLAAHADEADRKELVKKAVERDIKWMHYVLDNKQYRTYLTLLNTTLNNRGLNVNKYASEFLGSSDVAPYWHLRVGTWDHLVSTATEAALNLALRECEDVEDVNFMIWFGQMHTGWYDNSEMVEWLQEICK